MQPPEPARCIELTLLGTTRRIHGGPFDAFVPPGIGVCLEPASARANLASIRIDIADFAAPTPEQFVSGLAAILRAMRAEPTAPIYIGCRAGIGRTGTILAGLARLSGIADPIGFVRTHYHPDSVETPAQAAAVGNLDLAAVWRAAA